MPAFKKNTDTKKEPFFGRFGRKTGVLRKKNDIFASVFSIFWEFLTRKALMAWNFHRDDSSQKIVPKNLP